jgi:hypothetical protein
LRIDRTDARKQCTHDRGMVKMCHKFLLTIASKKENACSSGEVPPRGGGVSCVPSLYVWRIVHQSQFCLQRCDATVGLRTGQVCRSARKTPDSCRWCDTQRIASYARVFADARYRARLRPSEINDLIVDPMSACVGPVRAMIDAHDRLYGSGSGEAFLLGPYLDILPAVVVGQVKAPQR